MEATAYYFEEGGDMCLFLVPPTSDLLGEVLEHLGFSSVLVERLQNFINSIRYSILAVPSRTVLRENTYKAGHILSHRGVAVTGDEVRSIQSSVTPSFHSRFGRLLW